MKEQKFGLKDPEEYKEIKKKELVMIFKGSNRIFRGILGVLKDYAKRIYTEKKDRNVQ